MEAAATHRDPGRPLAGDKAGRIVDAMRRSLAVRGVAGSTFDHVAREAGVSRGLLHYYFGTKERLLVEVLRRDADLRIAELERRLAPAATAQDVIAGLVASLEDLVRNDPTFVTLSFELFTLARRNEEIAAGYVELLERGRSHVADLLRAKAAEGVLVLEAEAEAVADVLFALADGLALRMLADPGRDVTETVRAGVACVRALLDDRR